MKMTRICENFASGVNPPHEINGLRTEACSRQDYMKSEKAYIYYGCRSFPNGKA